MMEQINTHGVSFRKILVASPKIVLLRLALLNLFAGPARYESLCSYNWSGAYYDAFWVLVAAACLLLNKRWSYVAAIVACCSALYDFCRTALLFFGFLSLPANTDALELPPEIWWRVMQNHPGDFAHAGLATFVLVVAACYLLANLKTKVRVFK